MGLASPALTSFNAGELAPEVEGRTDIDKYAVGCHKLENFIPLVQGPVQRRPGTRFVAETKNSAARSWLRRFEFSSTQAFQIEFGDGYCRFYTAHGQLIVSGVTAWSAATNYVVGDLASRLGVNYYCILAHINQQPPNATYWYPLTGVIYEIPSPYAVADLTNSEGAFAFQIEQSGDVLYIAGAGIYKAYTLTRYGTTNWQFAEYAPTDGPFIEQNTTSTTLQASASTGSVTITASSATFVATDVGRLVRIDVQSFTIPPWEAGKAYAALAQVRSFGKTYKTTAGGTSGSAPPQHFIGSALDGQAAVTWAYQDSGYGIAKITAFTDTTHVTATVVTNDAVGLQQFPTDVVSAASKRWRLGAWSATTEYPRAVAFFNERLFWGGKLRWWGSVPGLYTSHTVDLFGVVTTDSAVSGILSAQDVNNIVWFAAANVLVIGTGGGEFGLSKITTSNPLGPANVQVVRQSKIRCRSIRAVQAGDSLMYLQRAARKLYAMDYNFYVDRYDSTNQSRLAFHITSGGMIDLAYQAEPYQVIWGARADGMLVGYTYDREDNVTGWHRHPVGGDGIAESVSVTPAPDGTRDELWLQVRRTINGATKRYIEFLEKEYETGDAQSSAFYVDAGLTYNGINTSATTMALSVVDTTRIINNVTITGPIPHPRTVFTTTPHEFALGNLVNISGVIASGDYDVNGQNPVNGVPTGSSFLVKPVLHVPTGAYTSGGVAVLQSQLDGINWELGGTLLLTASAPVFAATDINNEIWLYDPANVSIFVKVRISFFRSTTQVLVVTLADVPASLRSPATTAVWTAAPIQVGGLSHLEGKTVSILKDGGTHPNEVVTGGKVTLESTGAIINIGLPCPAKLVTMRIEAGGQLGTSQAKPKRVTMLHVRLINALGLKGGMEDGQLDDVEDNDPAVGLDIAPPFTSGDKEMNFPGENESDCRLEFQNTNPLPTTLAAIYPNIKEEELI